MLEAVPAGAVEGRVVGADGAGPRRVWPSASSANRGPTCEARGSGRAGRWATQRRRGPRSASTRVLPGEDAAGRGA